MASAVIVTVGVFFLAMGLYALVAPAALARPFGIVVDAPESRSEIRAVYGGFGVAVAVLLGVAAYDVAGIRAGAVVAVAAALAGMAFGRVVSRLVDRRTAVYPIWFYFGIEVVGAAALIAVV